MTPTGALLLFVTLVTLAALPSTSVALVLTRSAASGLAAGAAVTAGIVLGDLLFVCLALLGMSALAESLSGAFYWVRLACGGYLIYLGWCCWRAAPQSANRPMASTPVRLWRDTLTGLLITLADVKAIVFYASLFPAFVDLSRITVQGHYHPGGGRHQTGLCLRRPSDNAGNIDEAVRAPGAAKRRDVAWRHWSVSDHRSLSALCYTDSVFPQWRVRGSLIHQNGAVT